MAAARWLRPANGSIRPDARSGAEHTAIDHLYDAIAASGEIVVMRHQQEGGATLAVDLPHKFEH